MRILNCKFLSMSQEGKIDRTKLTVVELGESGNDLDYWLSRSVEERVQAIEIMRRVLYGDSAIAGRVESVLEIVELT